MKRVLPLALILSAAQGIGVTPPAQQPPPGTERATPHRCRVRLDAQPSPVLGRIGFKFLRVTLLDCGPGGFAEIRFVNRASGRQIPESGVYVLNGAVPEARLPPVYSRGGVSPSWGADWYSNDGRAWPVRERRSSR